MSGLREALEELHRLDDSVTGCRVCDADEQTWPCETARLLAAHPAEPAPLLPERNKLASVLHDVRAGHGWGSEYCQRDHSCADGHVRQAEAVLKLARPMPTAEQIDSLLKLWKVRGPHPSSTASECADYKRRLRNALLALLNGEES